jgi:hypothetical protein
MDVMSRKLDMVTAKCGQCDFESSWLIVEQAPEELRNRYAKRVAAWIEWKEGQPSTAEIVALRSLVQSVAAVSLQDLKRQPGETRVWDLGVMWLSKALDLQERGKGLHLNVNFSVVPEEPQVM